MKNLLIGLLTALLLSAGLVGVAESAATAVTCPYTGCVKTRTVVGGPGRVERRTHGTFCVTVATAGNGRPQGTVRLVVTKRHAFRYVVTKRYRSKLACFTTPRLTKRGVYTARAKFHGTGAFTGSRGAKQFRVVAHLR